MPCQGQVRHCALWRPRGRCTLRQLPLLSLPLGPAVRGRYREGGLGGLRRAGTSREGHLWRWVGRKLLKTSLLPGEGVVCGCGGAWTMGGSVGRVGGWGVEWVGSESMRVQQQQRTRGAAQRAEGPGRLGPTTKVPGMGSPRSAHGPQSLDLTASTPSHPPTRLARPPACQSKQIHNSTPSAHHAPIDMVEGQPPTGPGPAAVQGRRTHSALPATSCPGPGQASRLVSCLRAAWGSLKLSTIGVWLHTFHFMEKDCHLPGRVCPSPVLLSPATK